MGELIAVLSGKGGTGKTSICAGLATALAQAGHRVLCIDCDIGLRNLDIALGLTETAPISFLDVCRGDYRLTDALKNPVFPELYFLTAPVNCRSDQIDRTAFSSMLRQAREEFKYVFLDAPAGIELGFSLCASYADRVLLVTNPEPSAIRDASRTGEALELMGKSDVRLIINRIGKKMLAAMDLTVDDIMDDAGLPLLGIIPEDPNVTLAASFEVPLLRQSRRGAAAACRRIARRIQGQKVPVPFR